MCSNLNRWKVGRKSWKQGIELGGNYESAP